ncbi:hypothetical protein [Dyadobacter sp. 32]|uniref:hypothetical protein n=1 Tax=Dyadobacter sp. 32 TaxID=538966 RepID=UPI0011ECA6DC
MKRNWILIVFAAAIAVACENKITTDQVIRNLQISPKEGILADGGTKLKVSVQLDDAADVDKRNIVFTASNGEFVNGKDRAITKKAEFEGGQLIAKAEFVVPNTEGKIVFSAKPEVQSRYIDFLVKDSITLAKSEPKFLKLSASSFSVKTGYGSEVVITGKLTSEKNAGVSKNYKVKFEDIAANGQGAKGRFRQQILSSDANSEVSTTYSPTYYPAGSDITIHCFLLNEANEPTQIQDSIKINVINNN